MILKCSLKCSRLSVENFIFIHNFFTVFIAKKIKKLTTNSINKQKLGHMNTPLPGFNDTIK